MNRIEFEACGILPATGWPPWDIHSRSRSADTPGLHVLDLAACYIGAEDTRHLWGAP